MLSLLFPSFVQNVIHRVESRVQWKLVVEHVWENVASALMWRNVNVSRVSLRRAAIGPVGQIGRTVLSAHRHDYVQSNLVLVLV